MLRKVSAALLGLALFAGAARAEETTIKFTLGWKTQGSDAAFFYARDNGYFKEEGLNVVIDQGEGSGATVTRIMSGAYDAGFGDVNAIIQNASTRPQDAPVMVYMIWNQPPFAIVAKNSSGIKSIKDFEGHTLGGAQGTPTTRLLPVFVHKNGLDGDKIKVSNMAPNLQEPMLIKGDIDAALVFNITSYFNLVLNRQDPDKDFKWFSFGDYGMDLYSNGVMVSKKLLASNPKAVAGLVRAVNKGMIAVAKDQNAGMKAALNYDNLINVDVEKRRLQFSFDKLIVSPEMKEIGVGDIKDDRMARAIGIIVEGYQLTRTPTPSEIFQPRVSAAARRARVGVYDELTRGRRLAVMATEITATSLFSGPDRGLLDNAVLRHDDGMITSIAEGAALAVGPRVFLLPAFVNAHDHARATVLLVRRARHAPGKLDPAIGARHAGRSLSNRGLGAGAFGAGRLRCNDGALHPPERHDAAG